MNGAHRRNKAHGKEAYQLPLTRGSIPSMSMYFHASPKIDI